MQSIEFFTPDSLVIVLSAETFKISKILTFLDVCNAFLTFLILKNHKKSIFANLAERKPKMALR